MKTFVTNMIKRFAERDAQVGIALNIFSTGFYAYKKVKVSCYVLISFVRKKMWLYRAHNENDLLLVYSLPLHSTPMLVIFITISMNSKLKTADGSLR